MTKETGWVRVDAGLSGDRGRGRIPLLLWRVDALVRFLGLSTRCLKVLVQVPSLCAYHLEIAQALCDLGLQGVGLLPQAGDLVLQSLLCCLLIYLLTAERCLLRLPLLLQRVEVPAQVLISAQLAADLR
jgi:hypothetical protein